MIEHLLKPLVFTHTQSFFLKKNYFILEHSWFNKVFVSGVEHGDTVLYTHVSILFQILFPFRLLQNTEQSFLCCACCLSILNIAVWTCQSKTPTLIVFIQDCYLRSWACLWMFSTHPLLEILKDIRSWLFFAPEV